MQEPVLITGVAGDIDHAAAQLLTQHRNAVAVADLNDASRLFGFLRYPKPTTGTVPEPEQNVRLMQAFRWGSRALPKK